MARTQLARTVGTMKAEARAGARNRGMERMLGLMARRMETGESRQVVWGWRGVAAGARRGRHALIRAAAARVCGRVLDGWRSRALEVGWKGRLRRRGEAQALARLEQVRTSILAAWRRAAGMQRRVSGKRARQQARMLEEARLEEARLDSRRRSPTRPSLSLARAPR